MTAGTSAPTGRGVGQAPELWWQLWVRWGYSPRDNLQHAFQVEESQRGRVMQAMCRHTVRPCWIPPAGARRCPGCVLGVQAPGTGHRHRRVQLAWWSRLAARWQLRRFQGNW